MTKRHPGSRRVRHTHEADPDHVFLDKLAQIGSWVRSHRNVAVAGVAALVLTAAGIAYFRNLERTASALAKDQLELAHSMMAQMNEEGAKEALATLLERYAGSGAAAEARLMLGGLYLNSDDVEQAKVVLEPIGRSPDSPIEFQAALLLAIAFEQDNEALEAEALYLEVGDRAELAYRKREALGAVARLRADRGDLAGAADAYQRILDTFEENDPGRDLYVMRLEEVLTALNG